MSRIRFKLAEFENALVFQVLWMDENFRREPRESSRRCITPMGLSVVSDKSSSIENLGHNLVFLWGSEKSKDMVITTISFSNNMVRDDAKEKILSSLRYWAENWTGWNNVAPLASDCSKYEF